MNRNILFLFLTIALFACQGEPAEQATQNEDTAPKPVETSKSNSVVLGKMVNIEESNLVLDNSKNVALDAEDAVTLFLVRHAETMQGKTSLSGPGRSRTGRVANLFLGKSLSQVYADGNASMQTALAAAKGSEDVPFGIIQMDGTDAQAKSLVTNFKGKRVFMAMTLENLEILVNQLSGQTIDIPNEEYDNLFVVTARAVGDADVSHLKY